MATQVINQETVSTPISIKYDEAFEKKVWFLFTYTCTWALIFSIIAIGNYYQKFDQIIKILIYVSCAGGLGGVVSNFLGFHHYIDGDFDMNQRIWYYFRPLIAPILGIIAYFFIASGLMTLTGVNTPTSDFSKTISIPTIMFYCALAFLVGLSTHDFIGKLNDISGTIFTPSKKPTKPEEPQAGDQGGQKDQAG